MGNRALPKPLAHPLRRLRLDAIVYHHQQPKHRPQDSRIVNDAYHGDGIGQYIKGQDEVSQCRDDLRLVLPREGRRL